MQHNAALAPMAKILLQALTKNKSRQGIINLFSTSKKENSLLEAEVAFPEFCEHFAT